jgi:ribosome-binding ATPase
MEVGLVGLPQSGKSALLVAMTGAASASGDAAGVHYGVLDVPDVRLKWLAEVYQPRKVTHATVRFTDLVGRHGAFTQGELFTPQQLAHLRNMDALLIVLRCFANDSVSHVLGRIDPAGDLDLIRQEMVLSDLQMVEKRLERLPVDIRKRSAEKDAREALELELETLQLIHPALGEGRPVTSMALTEHQRQSIKGFGLLSFKALLPLANVGDLTAEMQVAWLQALRAEIESCRAWSLPPPIVFNAALEAELREMFGSQGFDCEEAREYLASMGLEGCGVDRVIAAGYQALGWSAF